jgi:peptidoglycan/LPS O-acetylase OafA/YrhL
MADRPSLQAVAPERRSGRRHFPCIDGVRAVAATMIVLTHATWLSGAGDGEPFGPFLARMDAGVAVFFVLSGFLLYRPFAAAHLDGGDGPRPGAYLWRRFLRLVPAYWVALTVTQVVMGVGTGMHSAADAVTYYGFLQVYDPLRAFGGIPQAWSLCVEVTFYLALPLWAAALAAGRRGRDAGHQARVELLALAAVAAGASLWRLWVLEVDGSANHLGLSWLPAYADLFAAGMALAVVSARSARGGPLPAWLAALGRRPGLSWGLAGASFWTVAVVVDLPTGLAAASTGATLARHLLYGLTAVFLVVPAVVGDQGEGAVRRLLRSRPVVAVGLVSYGLFLWHQAWMDRVLRWTGDAVGAGPFWLLLAAGLTLGLAAATASWFLVEAPLLRRRPDGRGRARTVPVASVAAAR